MGTATWTSLTKANLAMATAAFQSASGRENNTESLLESHPRGDKPATDSRLIILGYLHYIRGNILFLLEQTLTWIWLCLPSIPYFCPTTISGLTECLHGST